MIVREIVEYEHLVSFAVEDENGGRFHIQYRSDQIEKDEKGGWYFKTEPQPMYITRLPPLQSAAVNVSPALMDAIEKAIKLCLN
jgi:hypothetical protein